MILRKLASLYVLSVVLSSCASSTQTAPSLQFPPSDMFPEGIGIAADDQAYVGSLARSEIWQIDINTGASSVFTKGDADLMSVLGVHVSRDQNRIYACSSDPAQRFNGRGSELVSFDRASGLVYARYSLPGGGLCNDIAELADGTILVTDSVAPRILALTPDGNFLQWVEDSRFAVEGFGLNGIATVDNAVYVGVFATGSIFKIDTTTDELPVLPVVLNRPLAGPDGIVVLENGNLLVVEGQTNSVSRVLLEPSGTEGRVEVLADNLEGPTTAAINKGQAIVVQGQLGRFFGMDSSPVVPFELRVIDLPR